MKKISLLAILLSFFVLFSACNMGDNDSGSSDGNTTSPGNTLGRSLAGIPDFEVILPDSLAENSSTSTGASSVRALNDLSTITAENLDSVKSEGWYEMRENIGMDETAKMFLEILKDYAEEADLAMDTPFAIGSHQPTGAPIGFDMGTVMISGNSDDDFDVYWYLPYPLDLLGAEGTTPMYIFISVDKTGELYEVTLKMSLEIPEEVFQMGEPLTLEVYSYFNEATGESVMAQRSFGAESVKRSIPNSSDGSISVMVKETFDWGFGSEEAMTIGWGDDQMGGLVSKWSADSIDVEYYNGNGYLIKKGWGQEELYTGWLDWTSNSENSVNLADYGSLISSGVPDTLYMKNEWNDITLQTEVSLSLSADSGWVVVSDDYTWEIYYMGGIDWASGDCVYYYDSYDEENNVMVYTKGYELPQAADYFGGSYYMEDQYPLKSLLPLSGDYAGKTLMSREGETSTGSWTWENENGEEVVEDWSWTYYDYFIDDNNNGSYEYDEDIEIQGIDFYDVYLWDNTRGDYMIEKGAFFMTSGTLPSYFEFPAEDQSAVDAVNVKLEEIYNSAEFQGFSIDDYAANIASPYNSYTEIYDSLME